MSNHFWLPAALSLALLSPAWLAAPATAADTRPNILFILADDLGSEASALYPDLYDASIASGHGQVATPTLSALAARVSCSTTSGRLSVAGWASASPQGDASYRSQ